MLGQNSLHQQHSFKQRHLQANATPTSGLFIISARYQSDSLVSPEPLEENEEPTATLEPTPTEEPTATEELLPSLEPSPTEEASATAVATASETASVTPTATASETASPTATATATASETASPTRTASNTRTPSRTRTPTRTATATATLNPAELTATAFSQLVASQVAQQLATEQAQNATATYQAQQQATSLAAQVATEVAIYLASAQAQTASAVLTPSPSATASRTPSRTRTPTRTASASPDPAESATIEPSSTPSPTRTLSPSRTPSPTRTPSPSRTASLTYTASPSHTAVASRTPTVTRTPSETKEPTLTRTPSETKEATLTRTPSETKEPTLTRTPSETKEATLTRTPSETKEPTLTRTPSETKEPTSTREPTLTRTPSPTRTQSPSHTSAPSKTTSALEGEQTGSSSASSFDPNARLIINEVLPAPKNRFSYEWVELLNLDQRSHRLEGWMIDDDEGGSSPFKLGPDHVIEAGGLLLVELKGNILNNGGDTVRLLYPDGRLAASYSFGAAKADHSFIRLQPNKDEWELTDEPSPGLPNRPANQEHEVEGATLQEQIELGSDGIALTQAEQPAKQTIPAPNPQPGHYSSQEPFGHEVKHILYLSLVLNEHIRPSLLYAGPPVGEAYHGLPTPTATPSPRPSTNKQVQIDSFAHQAANELDLGMPPSPGSYWQWVGLLIGFIITAGSGLLYFMHRVVSNEDELLYHIASDNDGIQTDEGWEDLAGIDFDEEFQQLLSKKPAQES